MYRVLFALMGVGVVLPAVVGASELPPEPIQRMPASMVPMRDIWYDVDDTAVQAADFTFTSGASDREDLTDQVTTYDAPAETSSRTDFRWFDDTAVRPAAFTLPQFAPLPNRMVPPVQADAWPGAGWPQSSWSWQVLPDGLMYRSYLAGPHEPRFASKWIHERDQDWLWDVALGGRVGMLRYGTSDPLWPEGWQVDIEGAAFPRLTLEEDRDLVSVDFRFGIPITFRQGQFETKFAYYHLSSHLGDEYSIRHPGVTRINFSRDALVWGVAFYPFQDARMYAEVGWAFCYDGGTRPWEFQFGIDYSPLRPTGLIGAPFFAVNGHLRQEVDFGGGFTLQTGWQWRGDTGRLARVGLQYFNGMSDQYQFYLQHEEQVGVGVWYDY